MRTLPLEPVPSPNESLGRPGGRITTMIASATALLSTIAALLCGSRPATAQTINENFYSTDGTVHATRLSGNTLYIGGLFDKMGLARGGCVSIDAASGVPVAGFPKVVGVV